MLIVAVPVVWIGSQYIKAVDDLVVAVQQIQQDRQEEAVRWKGITKDMEVIQSRIESGILPGAAREIAALRQAAALTEQRTASQLQAMTTQLAQFSDRLVNLSARLRELDTRATQNAAGLAELVRSQENQWPIIRANQGERHRHNGD